MQNNEGDKSSPQTPNQVRSWKEPDYRNKLTPEQEVSLPPAPSDLGPLDDELLEEVVGGINTVSLLCPTS